MDPIAKTAYYCCGARALDASSPRSVCGDQFAQRFMDAQAKEVFSRFADMKAPNISNAARHRIIDDLLRERLQARPDLPIVLLGAGFDTRAFRLQGGRWLELDQPPLIELKNAKLPIEQSPNLLQWVARSCAMRFANWAVTSLHLSTTRPRPSRR